MIYPSSILESIFLHYFRSVIFLFRYRGEKERMDNDKDNKDKVLLQMVFLTHNCLQTSIIGNFVSLIRQIISQFSLKDLQWKLQSSD